MMESGRFPSAAGRDWQTPGPLMVFSRCEEGMAMARGGGKTVGALIVFLLLAVPGAGRAAPQGGMVEVGGGVRLHYLDFGGRGDPVILLAGLGNTAWIYEAFGAALARH